MTPEERAKKVVEEVREHKMFNVDTDGTWERYIAAAIEQATEGYLPIPDANEFDDVVRLLGIEDSHITPVEAVQDLLGQANAWKEACRKAGICMSCAPGPPEPFGCTDCLNTGGNGGSPALPREPGTCKCGAAPINKDGKCATCADEQPGPLPLWKAFHAAAWPKLWGIETTDPRAIEAGLEIVVAPCMPEHAAKSVAAIFNQQVPDFSHRKTLLTLLELLNPLHGEIDRQTYDERHKQGFDAPADAEYTVDITARMERDLTQAVVILEDQLRGQTK